MACTFPSGRVTKGNLSEFRGGSWWSLGEPGVRGGGDDAPTFSDIEEVHAKDFPNNVHSVELAHPKCDRFILERLAVHLCRGQASLQVWILVEYGMWQHAVAPRRFIQAFTEALQTWPGELIESGEVMEDQGLLDWQWTFSLDPMKCLGSQTRVILDQFEQQWEAVRHRLTQSIQRNDDSQGFIFSLFNRRRINTSLVSLLRGQWNGDLPALFLALVVFVSTVVGVLLGLVADVLTIIPK